MHLSALFIRTLISYIHFLFALCRHNKPYLTLLTSKELNIKYNAFLLKKYLVLYNTPNVFANFVFIVSMCSDHLKFISLNSVIVKGLPPNIKYIKFSK